MKKIIYSIFVLFILAGCSSPVVQEIPDYSPQITDLQNQINQINNKVTTLETNQIKAEDIKSIAGLQKQNKTYKDTSNITSGCPSKSKLNFWFDKWQEDEIEESQYRTVEDKYNECN